MDWQELELSVGDSVTIGNRVLTLIDLEEGHVAFRVDDLPEEFIAAELLQSFSPPAK